MRLLTRHALVVVLIALVLVNGTARAQTKAAEPSSAADDEVARGLFQAGKAAYENGKYEEALQLFEQAHARSGRPQLLFNIGQTAERLRQDQKALEVFRAYLTQVPDAPNRLEVEARIKQLEQWVAGRNRDSGPIPALAIAPTPSETAKRSQPGTDDPAYTESDQPQDEAVTSKWWFWTGLGTIVAGGTAVALAVALSGEDVEQTPLYQGNGGSLTGP
jgi:tetratricopeptide (TPR) repeat protein